MKKRIAVVVVVMSWVQCVAAETDCALASRYYELSAKAAAEYKQRDAYEFLERAVEACPTYQYFQQLGEAAAAFGEDALNARAAEAYVEAYALANSNSEKARAIGRYGELLFHANDPQKALGYVHEAKNLDPDSPWIAALAEQVDARSQVVTADDIKRGLGDMAFKPLKLQRTVEAGEPGATGATTNSTVDQRAVSIPLNFEFNSTQLDQLTAKNIEVLASTLAESSFAGKQFIFVGHADRRGSVEANMGLSTRRALAVFDAVVALQPSLAGRISTEGRGAEQPLALGNTEADYRANRRLQVIER